jgi:hypothetical protein
MNDPATKPARHRLSVLELGAALGNVTAASRQAKMDRTSFYESKRRFQTHSLAGLKDLPPIHLSHLATTPPEVVDQILAVASQYPTRGCVWISAQLKLRGVSVSSPSIQKIVHEHELGSRFERLLRLEAQAPAETVELIPAQVMAIEKANPCFKERHVESTRPGVSCCARTPSASATSRAPAMSICKPWWTPATTSVPIWGIGIKENVPLTPSTHIGKMSARTFLVIYIGHLLSLGCGRSPPQVILGWCSNVSTAPAPVRPRHRSRAGPDRTATGREQLGVSTHPVWTVGELLWRQVPPPRKIPPRRRGGRSMELIRLIQRWGA